MLVFSAYMMFTHKVHPRHSEKSALTLTVNLEPRMRDLCLRYCKYQWL